MQELTFHVCWVLPQQVWEPTIHVCWILSPHPMTLKLGYVLLIFYIVFVAEADSLLKEPVNIDDCKHVLKSEIESVHMASILCDEYSTLFALSSSTTVLVVVLKQHGILYDGLDMKS